MSTNQQYIGYLSVLEVPSGNGYSQVLFIVDENGYPVDYAYTDNITITETQRLLFGTTLRHYLITKVFGTQLLDDIESVPSILFVDSEDLLAIRENIEVPVFYLDRNKRYENSEKGLVTNEKYSNDRVEAKGILETCEENFDISEPFSRITEAITNNEDTSEYGKGGTRNCTTVQEEMLAFITRTQTYYKNEGGEEKVSIAELKQEIVDRRKLVGRSTFYNELGTLREKGEIVQEGKREGYVTVVIK